MTTHDLHVQKHVFLCYVLEKLELGVEKKFISSLITFYFKVLSMTVQKQVLFWL